MMNILLRRTAILLLLLIAGTVSQASGGVPPPPVVSIVTTKFSNGDSYIGNIDDNGRKNGHGKYTWADGDVYNGDWLADKIHGKGKYTWANGNVYDGDWLENTRHGKGKFTRANGSVYEGDWLEDKAHGKGKFTYANGDVYDGEYKDGWMHGKGKYTDANGAVYDGQYKDGLRNGLGTNTSKWKVLRYQGEWSNDKMHGKGAMSWFGNLIEFKGEWKDDRLTSIVRVRVDIDVFALLNRPMLISSSHLETLLPLDRLVHAIYSHAVHYFGFNHVLDLAVWTIFWTILWEFLFRDLKWGKSNNEPTVGVGVIHVDGTGDTDLVVRLNIDHSHCGICYEAFATDMETTDQTSQNLLPVMGPCGHYFCRGCIIARDHHAPNGPKGCPMCNRANQFDPDNLVHHRMLIDLLQRARPLELLMQKKKLKA